MEIAISRTAKKEATRQVLKETSLRCFCEHGFNRASIGLITQAAGVAHGTFYVHFASKEAVLEELLTEFNDGLAARLQPMWTEDIGAGLEVLVEKTAITFLDYWLEGRDFVVVYAERVNAGLTLDQLRDGINPEVAELLSTWLGEIAPANAGALVEPNLISQALLAMWMRVGMQYLFNENITREQAARTLVAMSLGALGRVLGGG